jgi:hypothetical protein
MTDTHPEHASHAIPTARPHKPAGQPYDHDLPPVGHNCPAHTSSRPWLAYAVAGLAVLLVGCVATRPAVSAKATVSVKEVALRVERGETGKGGSGELAANISLEMVWGAK